MGIRDIGHYILLTTQNFFRAIFILATGRGREPSRVEDGADDGNTSVNTLTSDEKTETQFDKFNALKSVADAKASQFSEYNSKSSDRNLFTSLELLISMHKALTAVVFEGDILLHSNLDAGVLENFSNELASIKDRETKIAAVITKNILKLHKSILEEVLDDFKKEEIQKNLAEMREGNPLYIANFYDIQEHLLSADTAENKQEWLRVFAEHMSDVFYSDYYAFDPVHKTNRWFSHLDYVLVKDHNIFELFDSLNNILRLYAMDDTFKSIPVAVRATRADIRKIITLEDLVEDTSTWCSSLVNAKDLERDTIELRKQRNANKNEHGSIDHSDVNEDKCKSSEPNSIKKLVGFVEDAVVHQYNPESSVRRKPKTYPEKLQPIDGEGKKHRGSTVGGAPKKPGRAT